MSRSTTPPNHPRQCVHPLGPLCTRGEVHRLDSVRPGRPLFDQCESEHVQVEPNNWLVFEQWYTVLLRHRLGLILTMLCCLAWIGPVIWRGTIVVATVSIHLLFVGFQLPRGLPTINLVLFSRRLRSEHRPTSNGIPSIGSHLASCAWFCR